MLAFLAGGAPAAAEKAATASQPSGEIRFQEGSKRLSLPPAAHQLDAEGIRLLSEGSYDEAIDAFDRSLKLARRNPRALANRGSALSQLGRLDEALKDFDAALALAPELRGALKGAVVETRVRRGRGRFSGGEVAPALDDFYTAIRMDRKDPRGYAAVASVGRQTRRSETCMSYATRALELGPETADTLADRAACLLALGRKDDALRDLNQAILLDHDRGELYASRAAVELELGRRGDAHRDARRAVELDPGTADQVPASLR